MKTATRHGRKRARREASAPNYVLRRWTLLGFLLLGLAALLWRAVDRQILETAFLQSQGALRFLRVMEMPAHRGEIVDRYGEPLAVSTPVESVWADPRKLTPSSESLAPVARLLGLDLARLRTVLARRSDRGFVYLQRRVHPDVARGVRELVERRHLQGVGLQREYRRFYPGGEVTSHLVGFTDIDDRGQEGLELAYDDWLTGRPGAKRVIKDGLDRLVEDVENIRAPRPGKELVLSVDRRLQFLAYRELKAAVRRHRARAGSAVILDVRSGELLAMVNQPSFNPNGRRGGRGGRLRNRAATDVFEPGSTIKPFVVAAALEQGMVRPETPVDTAPGYLKVGRHLVRDIHDYGTIDVTRIISKSSNVGISKLALRMQPEAIWRLLDRLGLGQVTGTQFPGEVAGQLPYFADWSRFEQATLSFGYGLSTTTLQLARAYAVLAADGVRRPLSLLKVESPPVGERVLRAATTRQVRRMLETVVSPQGTAPRAAIRGYSVAGKTGTARKAVAGGYAKDKYQALFAGMVPATRPRLVMVVMLDEPSAGKFYGGLVAAPVFAKVMADALRLLNIPPDRPVSPTLRLASTEVAP